MVFLLSTSKLTSFSSSSQPNRKLLSCTSAIRPIPRPPFLCSQQWINSLPDSESLWRAQRLSTASLASVVCVSPFPSLDA